MIVEHIQGQSSGISRGLQHQRRHRADEHRPGHPLGTVSADAAGRFAAAGGVPHVDHVLQVQRFHESGQVVGLGVHVIAVPGPDRAPMAPAVMSDAAAPPGGRKQHLVFPGVCAQRPAVAGDDGVVHCPKFIWHVCVPSLVVIVIMGSSSYCWLEVWKNLTTWIFQPFSGPAD